jgi:hypothetical protein
MPGNALPACLSREMQDGAGESGSSKPKKVDIQELALR